MHAISMVALVFALVLRAGAQGPSQSAVEADAARVLADQRASWAERTTTVTRVVGALAAERDVEVAGRLALLWMQAMRWTLAAVPVEVDGTRVDPYRAWLAAHEREVVYSEPAGQWLVGNAVAWDLHARHSQSRSGEALAWEIVENGLPGECEGYPPCYLAGLESLHGRYLREYPAGVHAAQAVVEIQESLDQIERLISGPDGTEFFDPATGCQDLVPGAESLRTALAGARVETTATRRALKVIRDRC